MRIILPLLNVRRLMILHLSITYTHLVDQFFFLPLSFFNFRGRQRLPGQTNYCNYCSSSSSQKNRLGASHVICHIHFNYLRSFIYYISYLIIPYISIMDTVVESEYVLVYSHTNISSENRPNFAWLRKMYSIFNRKYDCCILLIVTWIILTKTLGIKRT